MKVAMAQNWVAVAVVLLAVSAIRVEANPGPVWGPTGPGTWGGDDGDVEFLFEEVTPVLGGVDDEAVGVGAIDSFDNAGYSDTAQVDELVGVTATSSQSTQGFVRARGPQFVLNGKPFFMNGANLYYLMSYAANPQSRGVVTDILQQSAGVGLTVVRTWAFADGPGGNNLQTSPGVFSESTFRGLDFVVAQAKRFGIRLILSLVNNYPDYGGRPQYVKWAQSSGNWNAKLDDFYTDPTMRKWYKNNIFRVLTRKNTFTGVAYRDDPTIFSWELMNEPRCESDTSGRKFQGWIQEMASFVKSLDTQHMLEVGLEGFYSAVANANSVSSQAANPASYAAYFGTDFNLNGQISQIDFITVHCYPDSWVPDRSASGKMTFLANWVKTHISDAQYRLRKPIVFAEFGRSSQAPGYSLKTRIDDMTYMYNAVYASASTGGPAAGALLWQLIPPALQNSNQDGYGVVLSQNPAISSIMSKQSYRMSRL